jgi:hypothetical protein
MGSEFKMKHVLAALLIAFVAIYLSNHVAAIKNITG